MRKKSIVLTRFPFTDLSSSKRRPAVVLTKIKDKDSDVVVAFISSVIPMDLKPSDHVVNPLEKNFEQTGLLKASVFKMDKLATLDSAIFSGEIGEVPDELFEKLIEKLKVALEL